ncbi:MAG: hypothetical protein VKK59_04000 [Vampirovibrionales bacterium]|nr:hypothetical protein [Vampirovibrionales bacterium]
MATYEVCLTFRDVELSLLTSDVTLANRLTSHCFETLVGLQGKKSVHSNTLPVPQSLELSVPATTEASSIAPVKVMSLPKTELHLSSEQQSEIIDLNTNEPLITALSVETVDASVEPAQEDGARQDIEPDSLSEVSDNAPQLDNFEAVMDSMMRDLSQKNDRPEKTITARDVISDEVESPDSLQVVGAQTPLVSEEISIQAEPVTVSEAFSQVAVRQVTDLRFIDSLTDLMEQAKPKTMEESLLLTCYYLTFFDATANFTLKHVNSLLLKGGYPPVNHSVIEATIERGYLAVVPDLTGTAEMTEYQLSDAGQTFTERLL